MNLSGTVEERTYREPSVDEGRPIYPRQGTDRDSALLAQLRRGEAGAAAFGSWVYRITANAAYQKLRVRRRSQRNEVSWDDLAPAFDDSGQHVEAAVDWSRPLKDPAIEGELKRVLRGAIDELSATYRAAFLLHDVEGLSNLEIAETLQVRPGAIKTRVHRARLFLRKRLADYVGASLAAPRSSALSPASAAVTEHRGATS